MKNRQNALEDQAKIAFEKLPQKISDFELEKIFAEDDDKFFYFGYNDKKNHRAIKSYFHEETSEFKVRVKIGLNEFCLTEFFTMKFEKFVELLQEKLPQVIKNFDAEILDPIIDKINFGAWEFGKNLPKNLEGFELFISPQKIFRYTNGSYILINYSDFENLNDLTIYYNVYVDNFTGEARIKNSSQVIYSFDAENLQELETKLQENLSTELAKIKAS